MLTPGLCQVDIAPDLKSQASAASLESALSIAKLYDSQPSLARLSGASLGTRRSQHTAGDAPASAEQQASAPSAPAEPGDPPAPAADAAVTEAAAEASGAANAAEAAAGAAEAAAEEEADAGQQGGYLTGLLCYRAPMQPPQNGKLESFDRKIGRAANALRVRCMSPASWLCFCTLLELHRVQSLTYAVLALFGHQEGTHHLDIC